jgi:hypothetical protein
MSESFYKVASGLNVFPLQTALKRQPKLFGKYNFREEMYGESPHKQMKDIWVRYNDINKYPNGDFSTFNHEHDSVWYPAYYALPQVRPLIFTLMALVEGERLGAVLITKVPPGGTIAPHIDSSWHADYYDKYYVPIQNESGATFNFEDGTIYPQLGDAWWFDNSVVHWVENNSNEDRIAMIVCIKSDRVKEAGKE